MQASISTFPPDKSLSWNEPAIDFYLSIGAEQMDWELFHLDGDDLKKLANL